MFEYIEAEVDSEVERGLFQTKVALSKEVESPVTLQDKMSQEGLGFIKVVGLSERKFLLRSEKEEGWENFGLEPLLKWFSNIRSFEEKDLYLSRIAWLECKGLPMNAWVEENLKAFTKPLGEWISWTYQKDNMNVLFNPLICLSTASTDPINEEMKILVKGKHCHISFSEILEGGSLKGKMLPMEESNTSFNYCSKAQESTKVENSVLQEEGPVIENEEGILKVQANGVSQLRGDTERVSASKVEDSDLVHRKESSPLKKNELFDIPRQEVDSVNSVSVVNLSNQQEEHTSSGGQSALSSQISLCNNLVGLKMGRNRGRPKKRIRSAKNPFDLGLSKIRFSKKFKVSGGKGFKSYEKRLEKELLKPISEEIGEDLRKEADSIVKCAQDLGLEFAGDKEEIVQAVASQLQDGSL